MLQGWDFQVHEHIRNPYQEMSLRSSGIAYNQEYMLQRYYRYCPALLAKKHPDEIK
jgi:hypothetical protein